MTSTKEPNRVFRESLAKQAKEVLPSPPGSVSDCDCLAACNGIEAADAAPVPAPVAAPAAGAAALLFEAALLELLEPLLLPLFDPPDPLPPLFAPGKIALKLVVASETISPKIDCGCPCWKSR
jgi:hypothetical protein